MSLDWQFHNKDGFAALAERYPDENNRRALTDSIVFACMAVDIGRLDRSTAAEFFARLNVWETLKGSFIRDGEGKPKPFTYEDVAAFAAADLWTNVSYKSAAEWMARVIGGELRDLRSRFTKVTGIPHELYELEDEFGDAYPMSGDEKHVYDCERLLVPVKGQPNRFKPRNDDAQQRIYELQDV